MADALALLSLYLDWGVDTALDDQPHDRLQAAEVHAAPPVVPDATSPLPPQARTPKAASLRPTPTTDSLAGDALRRAAGCATIEALGAALRDFDGCALRQTATHTLAPTGAHGAPVMVVGEAPEAEEDRTGQLLDGPIGALTRRMFQTIGLEAFSYAPVVPWRPPGGRPPSDIELRLCLPFLRRAIVLLAPRRLVVMGALPARVLLDDTPARLRGRWHALDAGGDTPVQALVMRHPGQFAASPAARRESWQDLLRLRAELDKEMT
ncbi:bacteriophage-type DNA polymerase [Ameyamaea chiangmaiensis NBRC 103196]|uniref:Uracil-DNA glycosylase n=1 Tax=Ameyamaea chiangmaiensis TaxID=442969 RepID=A0A850PBP2_9PROT|nr:uracil-DNA glycosylase [Ameyamaea chiangmaiensis]MBS4075762.1 uracil-DNA glycosylase [Ameyamaea chiangmaiensis]NVN41368.1 uracil-DNA glycosylase [Ameyamaea chiangmaiensis]GBQ70248.1 bacteriophage-type DNA polymerase [Ameyamaea chiangmaiensis NBRC 103196]